MAITPAVGRRRFLQAAASGAAAATLACGGSRSPYRFLTMPEAECLAAVCDAIVPPDQDPGASAAGVVHFIDRQLCGHYKKHRRAYREGLATLDRIALKLERVRFTALSAARRTKLLESVERGKLPPKEWGEASPRAFFQLAIDHTLQGFYGNPKHGGNRDFCSWKMLGVPIAPVRGRLHYDLTEKG